MSDKLIIEDVENTAEQLKFMPLKGSIRLKLSDSISPEIVKNYIKVYRLRKTDGVKNYPFSYSDALRQDLAGFVDINISVSGQVLIISPKDAFTPSSDYILFISNEIHTVKNKITQGGEELGTITIFPPSESSIKIEPISPVVKSKKSKVFVANIFANDKKRYENHLIDIATGFDLDGSHISFSEDFSIGKGLILVDAEVNQIMDNDYELRFTTGTPTTIEDKIPDGTSTKVSTDDIMKFYESPYSALISQSINGNVSIGTPGSCSSNTPSVGSGSETEFPVINVRYPNKIHLKFDKEINKENTDISKVEIDIYEAFDNYNLPKMGLYHEDIKYILEFSIIRGGKTLQIELICADPKDTSITEPITKRWKE